MFRCPTSEFLCNASTDDAVVIWSSSHECDLEMQELVQKCSQHPGHYSSCDNKLSPNSTQDSHAFYQHLMKLQQANLLTSKQGKIAVGLSTTWELVSPTVSNERQKRPIHKPIAFYNLISEGTLTICYWLHRPASSCASRNKYKRMQMQEGRDQGKPC